MSRMIKSPPKSETLHACASTFEADDRVGANQSVGVGPSPFAEPLRLGDGLP
jgi:hypothetical protein